MEILEKGARITASKSKNEALCPHRERVSPIVESLIEADGVILASPVYGLDGNVDKEYWRTMGWLEGKRPF